MIMARLTSPEINRVGGIWQGMSGSPVYAGNGRLIGAVAYGLSLGPSRVAGLTPFETMDDYMGPAAIRIPVGQRAARVIASATDLTEEQAAGGFTQLPMPLGVSGVGSKRLQASRGRSWLPNDTYAAGSAGPPGVGPGVETIVAGGNLGAALSYGDITMAGVGTTTSVCGDRVVGFGHPMAFLGRTTEMLLPADAIYIQEDPTLAPFKVANLGLPVGTLTDDRTTAITGTLGPLPETTDISSRVTFGARSRTGRTHVSVPMAAPSAVFYQVLANNDRVIDGLMAGSELQTWTIKGHTAAGPWILNMAERYVSSDDITFEVPWEIADQVYFLGRLPGVTIDRVWVAGTVNEDTSVYSMGTVRQYQAGAWRPVSTSNPIRARAGQTLRLKVALNSASGSRNLWVALTVPKAAGESRGRLSLVGGYSIRGDN